MKEHYRYYKKVTDGHLDWVVKTTHKIIEEGVYEISEQEYFDTISLACDCIDNIEV